MGGKGRLFMIFSILAMECRHHFYKDSDNAVEKRQVSYADQKRK